TRSKRDWSSDVCSSDLEQGTGREEAVLARRHAELRRGPDEFVPNVHVAVGAGFDVGLELLVEPLLIVQSVGVAPRPAPCADGRRSEERRVGKGGRPRVS